MVYNRLKLRLHFDADVLTLTKETLEKLLIKQGVVFDKTKELLLSLKGNMFDDDRYPDLIGGCFSMLLSKERFPILECVELDFNYNNEYVVYIRDTISEHLKNISTLRSVKIRGAQDIFSGLLNALKSSPIETLKIENCEFPFDDVVFLIKSKPLKQLAINLSQALSLEQLKKNHTTYKEDCCLDLSVKSENAKESRNISIIVWVKFK